MKIRTGFVSNSSSSSFIVKKNKLTDDQINLLINHFEYKEKYGYHCDYDEWRIKVEDIYIKGETSMDNFDMGSFCFDHDIPAKFN